MQGSTADIIPMDGTRIDNFSRPTKGGSRIHTGIREPTPESSPSSLPQLLLHNREVHTDSAAAILSASASNAWWTADSPPTSVAAASAYIHTDAGIPNPSLHTRLDPPRHPHHLPCWPPPGPTGPTCLVDADSELARALAADPFHLDWPHW